MKDELEYYKEKSKLFEALIIAQDDWMECCLWMQNNPTRYDWSKPEIIAEIYDNGLQLTQARAALENFYTANKDTPYER